MLNIHYIRTKLVHSEYASINLPVCINQYDMNKLSDILIGIKEINYFNISSNNLKNDVINNILKILHQIT